ncbi:MAG: hypothetical protein NG740_00950 [Omnitrophica bacterium]|nr:hypothetical protein [Candidatus Omnitrophota bacterium]
MKYIFLMLSLCLFNSLALAETHIDAKFKFPYEQKNTVLEQYDANTTTKAYSKLSLEDRIRLIQDILERYRKTGVQTKYTAAEYIYAIDNVLKKNPDYTTVPLGQIIKMILEEEGKVKGE